MSFASNLTAVMNHRNVNADQAAALCGISKSEFDAYLNCGCVPDPPTLRVMAERFGVRVVDLAGDDDLQFRSFGEDLRELRKKNGLTCSDVAKLIDVNPSVITKIESGLTKTPTSGTINKLKDLFGEDVNMIVKKYDLVSKNKKGSTTQLIIKPKTDADVQAGKMIGANISKAAKHLGMTYRDLAKASGLSMSTMNRIRAEGYQPTDETLDKIATALKVDASTLKVAEPPKMEAVKPEPVVAKSPKMAVTEMLDYIDDDAEYRAAAREILHHIIDGTELHPIGMPQADLIIKMIGRDIPTCMSR